MASTLPSRGLRGRLVENPGSVGERQRARRWRLFVDAFPDLSDMVVLDLGGRSRTWACAPGRAGHVYIVNREGPGGGPMPDWVECEGGDACDPSAAVRGRRYDLVFSNSVIEHVGGYSRRLAFADTVRGLAPCHWVQTPYRYFPIEPHVLFPGFQFLPLNLRGVVGHWWPLIHTRPADHGEAIRRALETELLGRTEFGLLFPESVVYAERMAGLPKSLIAVRAG